jgi:hypothetical protein
MTQDVLNTPQVKQQKLIVKRILYFMYQMTLLVRDHFYSVVAFFYSMHACMYVKPP